MPCLLCVQEVETFRVALHNSKVRSFQPSNPFLSPTSSPWFSLICAPMQHKSSSLVWTSGTPLAGERLPVSDIDFYIDGDMIHIADIKVARCYGEYFITHINRMLHNA
eukprot:m.577510 g.577510  ORF g.577510 m.577510 type:complete len:108 (+) comp57911_c0_seq3:1928-2251(+)